MKNLFELIGKNPLFDGIDRSDFENLTTCLDAKQKHFKKGEIIFLAGTPVHSVGLILRGHVQVIRESEDGKVQIIAEFSVSDLFGEVFACAEIPHCPVTVIAVTNCDLLFLDYHKIITTCSSSCVFHARLIKNMLHLLAQKNLMLNQKLEILSKRGIRERLQLFFNIQRGAALKFTIPFNREELASYLCVDRSALSNELGKMQEEGLLRFRRNKFELLTSKTDE